MAILGPSFQGPNLCLRELSSRVIGVLTLVSSCVHRPLLEQAPNSQPYFWWISMGSFDKAPIILFVAGSGADRQKPDSFDSLSSQARLFS